MNFGGSRNYRVALHEWTSMYGIAQIMQFDGPDAVINDGGIHFWPYGLNYDRELTSDRRHVMMIAAMRRDTGIASTLWMPTTTSIPDGTYRLVPRNATSASLDVADANSNTGTSININNSTPAASQQFLVDLR